MEVEQKARGIFGNQLEWCHRKNFIPPGYYMKLTIEQYPRWLGKTSKQAIETLKQIADDYIALDS